MVKRGVGLEKFGGYVQLEQLKKKMILNFSFTGISSLKLANIDLYDNA